uniref:Ribosome-recycling factor n=1 Tax=Magnetococcus massalia (strain MO-1) TaxID=451514 RepID=A0A1S7LFC4_MAGMO|nr:Ribosome recycling factor (Ribosome-releasing factor) (RRF) [Candidatus Magnetococcus massalia]
MDNALLKDLKTRMGKTLSVLMDELASVRTGRASASLLDQIVVEAYGQTTPLNQVASVTVPEARLINVQPWDKSTLGAIEKAILESDLGLNPNNDGQLIRVPLPELTEERRKELVKLVHKYGEQTKIGVRNIRRDGIESLRKAEKNKEISQDDMHGQEKQVQELTDNFIKQIDEAVGAKEDAVMQV